MTQLTYDLSRALAKDWGAGDEVVVTRLDHDGNIRPWVQAAAAAGATVRWADVRPGDRRAGARAVTGLSGTDPAGRGHRRVQPARHPARRPGDRRGGARRRGAGLRRRGAPHPARTGRRAGARRRLLRLLAVQVLRAAPRRRSPPTRRCSRRCTRTSCCRPATPSRSGSSSARSRTSCWPATTATVDFIAGLVPGDGGAPGPGAWPRWPRSRSTRTRLFDRLDDGLRGIDGVTLHGDPAGGRRRCCSRSTGRAPREVYESSATLGVNAPAGSFYAMEASRWIGLGDAGAVRAGLAPYTDDGDVDRLLYGVAEVCA